MKLAIYGAGGLGREVLVLAQRIQHAAPRWDEMLFIDDIAPNREVKGTAVITFEQALSQDIAVVIAVGEPEARARLAEKVLRQGIPLATLIHPDVVLTDCSRIGAGCVLSAGVFISCDVVLGQNVYLQPYSSVGHDCQVGNHSVLSTYVTMGGNCLIGERVFIGMSAVIQQRVTVGKDVIIGMGAAVFNSVQEGVIALGNPARVMRKNDEKRVFK
ncbi:NeuD/PglB/VioB family sugar acetyltransferase [Erwinia sp. ErVv1]|uniref:NeuD/PglB/VioB family sugar acetyltransferase n=1 Tax=Erwinia sp. ErVv1 TaxID=1603299 RepID=UPI00082B5A4D|nr:NeuD/PglB/VioB family sugar acetyltransferase [Erwinia sp. ErVv1]